MDVIEITRQLGQAIQQDPVYIRYALCKEQNDQDSELQNLIGEFNLNRIALNNELSKEDKDEAKVQEYNKKLRDSYNLVMQNQNMIAFNEAKVQMDQLINRVNGIIALCVEGQDPETCEPSACSGSCATCGGCH